MLRKIVEIAEDKCTGCGLCADACHEGAIIIQNGKAKLLRDDYCDGLGDCLPICPADAITIVEREAVAYDEKAVAIKKIFADRDTSACDCPGNATKTFHRNDGDVLRLQDNTSQLMQWPVQIQLVSTKATYFENADLLIAADCTAYAYGDFHNRFIRNHITLVGCPKLDSVNYTEKLTEIICNHTVKSITIVRMEVPCCGGLQKMVVNALKNSGKFIPWRVVTISTKGEILN